VVDMSRRETDLREDAERAVTELVESLPVTETSPSEGIRLVSEPVILVTGFEPFGSHTVNPSQELAKLLDGRRIGRCAVAGSVLPVHHREAARQTSALLGDNAGYRAEGEPCVPEGPPAYFATLPLPEMLAALVGEGVPAYVSNTAGTYLCNQTFYQTLHEIATRELPTRAGFVHLPLLPSMVAASNLDQASMDLALALRGAETLLRVVAEAVAP
jgi:pyroglutamyl-peptidase